MMNNDIQSIAANVQRNCHISDARQASDYTLCIYLLKMREFYRWEHDLATDVRIEPEHIGPWLSQRENLWDSLEDETYQTIQTVEHNIDCFDAAQINQTLNPLGYVYSAGYGPREKAIFYLAELEQQQQQDGYQIYISGHELARDLTAPVAMSQQQNIFIRRESLQRMIWEKIEEWGWYKNHNAMHKAMQFYDFENQPQQALTEMTDAELNSVILHEIGEIKSANQLSHWHQLLTELPRSHAEFMARAIKDIIADCQTTLPALIEQQAAASLHFYFSNFTHMRKELAPSLLSAYQTWAQNKNYSQLLSEIESAAEHWLTVALGIQQLFLNERNNASTSIEQLVNENRR